MSRVAVKMDETIPVTGVDELDKHLDELIADPTIPSNIKLFDDVTLQLTRKFSIYKFFIWSRSKTNLP